MATRPAKAVGPGTSVGEGRQKDVMNSFLEEV